MRRILRQFFPTITAQPSEHIGIVAGHYSKDKNNYDPGAVCEDGLTEQSVNFRIATLVMQKLTAMGYQVDMLAGIRSAPHRLPRAGAGFHPQ